MAQDLADDHKPLVLTAAELCVVTGRKRYRAQSKVLAQLGITHRIRPDGMPLVSRTHFEEIMGSLPSSSDLRSVEPDWSHLDAP